MTPFELVSFLTGLLIGVIWTFTYVGFKEEK